MRRKAFPYRENSPSNFWIFQDGLPCRWPSIMVGHRVQGFSMSGFLMSTSSHVGATWASCVPFYWVRQPGVCLFCWVRLPKVRFLWIYLPTEMRSSVLLCRKLYRSKNILINCPLNTWVRQFHPERTNGVADSCSHCLLYICVWPLSFVSWKIRKCFNRSFFLALFIISFFSYFFGNR